jgi:ubiquinone/menaquinone biosynthesis C-methylase UbiE
MPDDHRPAMLQVTAVHDLFGTHNVVRLIGAIVISDSAGERRNMEAHFDQIAEQYRMGKRLPMFEVVEHTLVSHLGDITGRSVFDLACGEGFSTRTVKRLGAGRTVGIDISAEMIKLALAQEATTPWVLSTCASEPRI